eukprot:202540_1
MTKRCADHLSDVDPPLKRQKLNEASQQCQQITQCQNYLRCLLQFALMAIKHRNKISNLQSFKSSMPRIDTIFKYFNIIKNVLKCDLDVTWHQLNVTINFFDRLVPQSYKDNVLKLFNTPSCAVPPSFLTETLYELYVENCSDMSHSYCNACDGFGIYEPYKLCRTCDGNGHSTREGGFVCPKCEKGIVEIPCDEEDCLNGCDACDYEGTINDECLNCHGKWRRKDCPHCLRTGNFLFNKLRKCKSCDGSGIINEAEDAVEDTEDINTRELRENVLKSVCIAIISKVIEPAFEQYKHEYVNKLERYQYVLDRYKARIQKKYKVKYTAYSLESVKEFISDESVLEYIQSMAKKYVQWDEKRQDNEILLRNQSTPVAVQVPPDAMPQLEEVDPQNEYKEQYMNVLRENNELKQKMKRMEIEIRQQTKTIHTLKNVLKKIHHKKNETNKDLKNTTAQKNKLQIIASALEKQITEGHNPRKWLIDSAKCDDWIERTETVKKWKEESNEQHEMEIDQYKEVEINRSMVKNVQNYLNLNDKDYNYTNPITTLRLPSDSDTYLLLDDVVEKFMISNPCRVPNLVGSYGVRAKMDITKNVVLCRYVGFEMTHTEWSEVFDFSNEETLNGMYLYSFELDDKRSITIDPIYGGKHALAGLYINDCRKDINVKQLSEDDIEHKNCEFKVVLWKGWPTVFIVTIKDILEGEELLLDYSDDYWSAIKVTNRWTMILKRMKELCKKNIVKNTDIHDIHNGIECHDLTL